MNSWNGATENKFIPCAAGAGLAGATCLAVTLYQWPDGNIVVLAAWSSLFSFGVFCAFVLLLSIPAVITTWLEHRAYWRTLRPISASPISEPIIITRPPARDAHAEAWRDYWLAALDYAAQVGGVSYQRTRAFFNNDLQAWKENFAYPLAHAGYTNPVQPSKETLCAPGWTIERIRWSLEAGRTPTPPPHAPPEKFAKQSTAQTVETVGETAVFASEH